MVIIKFCKHSKAFTLIELMVVIAILSILMTLLVPNYIAMRNKAFCSEAETDAQDIAAAVVSYFGVQNHTSCPSRSDLKISIKNPAAIDGDPNGIITISVTDRTGRCPAEYQNSNPRWNSNVYTMHIQ